MKPPTISYLSDIYFESGAVDQLGSLVAALNIRIPLVVTDEGIVNAGLIDRLPLDGPAIFGQVDPNPTQANVHQALAAFRGHRCDGIIAVGGGSPMDCAKAAALLVEHEPPLADYAK